MPQVWESFLGLDGWKSRYPAVDAVLRHYMRKVGSEGTRKNVGFTLYRFAQHAGLQPEALTTLSPQEASRTVQAFTDGLKESGRSIRYVNVVQAYLKTFYEVNGFRGPNALEVERYHQPARYRKREQYVPTPEEIRSIAEAARSLKMKALTLGIYTSGLRNSTIRALRYGDVKAELEAGLEVVKVPVYPEMKRLVPSACKGNIPYYSFISGEAVEALKAYLTERKTRFNAIADDEPLFCSDSTNLPPEKQRQTPVAMFNFERGFKKTVKRAGLRQWENVTPKALRPAFEAALRNARLDPKDQEFLMGHILPGSQDPYYDRDKEEELRAKYAVVEFFPEPLPLVQLQKREILRTARIMNMDEDRFKKLQELLARASTHAEIDEAVEEFQRLRTEEEADEPKERDPVRVVHGEEALIEALEEGWRLVKELNGDRYLVEKGG